MLKKQDISRAISLFRDWDNNDKWEKPHDAFLKHTLNKAEDSLITAKLLLNVMENKEIQRKLVSKEDYNASLWIVNSSYYSMFFLTQLLLGKEGKKVPEGTKDAHKTTLLAFLYYFIIKGSGLEGKKNIFIEDIKSTRLSNALLIFKKAQEESEELLQVERVKNAADSLKLELDKRTELTYRSTRNAELSFSKTSIERAKKFREMIMEYMHAKNLI